MKKSFSNSWRLGIPIVLVLAIGLICGIPILNMRQTEPTTSGNITGNILKVSEKCMWNLNLNDFLLNNLYEQAYKVAVQEIPDAKLNEFDIDVFPYSTVSKVRITYCFYSKSADRELDYVFYDNLRMVLERDISGIAIVNRVAFENLPWLTTQEWMPIIKKVCENVSLLTPYDYTGYLVWVVNSPKLTWHININDSINWHWTLFKWHGQGDPILVKQFGEDIIINHLIYYP